MENDLSVDKRILWRHLNKKMRHTGIHSYHVFSVLTILFDEMLNDLKQGKVIKICNFGSLFLKDLKPRKYFDVTRQQVMFSRGYRILRFTLAASIRKKLTAHLDLDKTFGDD